MASGAGTGTGGEGGAEAEGPDGRPGWVAGVREALAAWYDRGHRDLPWRRTADPYRVLVSELMLVQTTVAAVVPHFGRFLARFPTVHDLAAADEAEVLKAWEGLGYYRRARHLHAAARAVVERHAGVFPDDLAGLRALPGVGRYIAGAVRSFAFDLPAPILEANTQRVLARLLAWPGVLTAAATQQRLWRAAERLVPAERPGRFNQAFMELGATVCLPRRPDCLLCPVTALCSARQRGLQDALPALAPRAKPKPVAEACVLVERDGGLLMVQRARGGLWEDFWELPTAHVEGADPAGRAWRDRGAPGPSLAEVVAGLAGVAVAVRPGPPAHRLRYGVTTHQVSLAAHAALDGGGDPRPDPARGTVAAGFVTPEAARRLTLSAPTRRLLAWAARDPSWRAGRTG